MLMYRSVCTLSSIYVTDVIDERSLGRFFFLTLVERYRLRSDYRGFGDGNVSWMETSHEDRSES